MLPKSLFCALLLIHIGSLVIVGTKAGANSCRLDLAFVVDASNGLCDKNTKLSTCDSWTRVKRFIVDTVLNLNISIGDVQVALITYGESAKLQWPLEKHSTVTYLWDDIDKLEYDKSGKSNITAGLTTLRNEVFGKYGDRPDAPNKAVIITDGPYPENIQVVRNIVNSLQSDGITTLAVGSTEDIKEGNLEMLLWVLASQPKQPGVSYFKVKSSANLGDVTNPLLSHLCQPVLA